EGGRIDGVGDVDREGGRRGEDDAAGGRDGGGHGQPQGDRLVVDVGGLPAAPVGQVAAGVGPAHLQGARGGGGGAVVAHVDRVDHAVAAELRQGGGVADREARGERHGRAGDGADAAVVLEEVVAGGVLLAAVVEDAELGAVRRDGQGRLPLVGGGGV